MKKYITRIIAVLLTLALALSGLWYINRVLIMKRTDGILTMQSLYAQPENSIDVLLVGNSHSGINIDTATLYDEYGVAAYNLWGGVQPLWNSYYNILEALKTQHPKLIVLEVMAATSDYEYSEEQTQIKNTAGMRLSENKLNAVVASAPEERRLNLLLGFPLYHGRFDELTAEDFKHFPWSDGLENFKGSTLRYGVGRYEHVTVDKISELSPIMDKELDYLTRIIDLCKSEDIPLLLLKTPSVERTATQPYLNSVAVLAEENGLEFINMNLMDAELDITEADWSLDAHLNAAGARKISRWLGERFLALGIPDRRDDPAYLSWQINSHNVNNEYLTAISDTADYIAELERTGRTLLVIKNSPWEESEEYCTLMDELRRVGVPVDMMTESANDAVLVENTALDPAAPIVTTVEGESMTFTLDGETLTVNFEYQDIVHAGKKLTWFGADELTLVVYDTLTHETVDILTFNTLTACKLNRASE